MWFWVCVIYILMVLVVFNSKKVVGFINLKRRIDFSKTLPGPSFRELLKNAKRERILPWLQELREKHGPLFRIWFGKDLFVFITDPEDAKIILSNNQLLHKSRNYQLLEPWLGKGLLTNGGEDWHKRRKLLTPAFHFKILSAFKQPMEDNCDILINKLNAHIDGEAFDIYPYITLFALDAICETAMGIKKLAQIKSESDYVKAVQTICRIAHRQSFSWWQRINFLFNLSSAGKQRNQAVRVLHSETKRVIEVRRKMLETENINNFHDVEREEDIGSKRRFAFLDILLIAQKEGAQLTDKHIREEVDTFLFEGHDTTSSALSFTIYLLSQHPEVQRKAYEEAKLLEGQEKEPMKYLEAVIKEALRLYPAVPFFSRLLTEDFILRDKTIPCGTAISVLAYMIHRDSKEFNNPEKFIPERFLNSTLHPYAYVAFSAGPRNCIGQKFAMLEMKCTLAKLLRNFNILPVENFEFKILAELVMKSDSGIQIKLKKRDP